MKKIKKITVVMTLIAGILLFQNTKVFASDVTSTELAIYEEKLAQLNEELGTDYKLQPSTGFSYDEMVEYFTNMTIDEFETYIRNAYLQEQALNEKMENPLQEIIEQNSNTRSTLNTQYYCYDGKNMLYMKAYTTTVSGTTVYTGDVLSTGSIINEYPAYDSTSCTVVISSTMRTAECSWICVKYVSANVASGTYYVVSCTFTAGGGNIYPIL
ncbi:MAG: hypothetical protein LUG83_03165 [Lachnospiraceae bacterium]|nr:hypothetical protein [Lachnospiraceae bacterium]